MQKSRTGLIAVGLVRASSALVVGQSQNAPRIKGHGSLASGTNRYQFRVTIRGGSLPWFSRLTRSFTTKRGASMLQPTANSQVILL
jgi:hypothetical protein